MTALATPPAHSDLSPSGASCWTICTAQPSYVRANKDKIKDTDTEYSKEGTIAHDWASKILLGLADLSEVPDGMREPVGEYIALCERLKQPGDTVLVEQKVPLFYKRQHNGTVDYCLVSEKRIYILDYKHGQGVIVEAKKNKQTATYGYSEILELMDSGLYDFSDDTLVTLAIFQPRAHSGDKIKIWALSLGELREFCETQIRPKADLITANETDPENNPVEFAPSDDTCRFCDAKGFCVKRKEFLTTPIPFDVVGAFGKKELADTIADNAFECLEPEQIANLIRNRKAIVKWLDDVEESAKIRLEAGDDMGGYLKLVAGKEGNRAWSDEAAADTLVSKYLPAKERYTEPKLKSAPQILELLEPHKAEFSTRFQNRLNELVVRPAGKPTMVLSDDPRPSIMVKAEAVFADETAAPAPADEGDPLA